MVLRAMSTFPIHARTITGLEPVLAEELEALGAKNIEIRNRVVTFLGDQELLYKANVGCRAAIRILRPLSHFPANNEQAFYKGIRGTDWTRWMSATGKIAIDANVSSSFTSHSLYLAQLAKDAIVDFFREKEGKRPSVDLDDPDLRVVISLFQNQVQVFVDSSGESLHKRGYRTEAGAAPLNEALAAGMIKLTGWNGSAPLVDMMTGSATLLIEAGLIARNIAPGLLRKTYGFQKWPDYSKEIYTKIIEEAKGAVRREAKPVLLGLEKDPEVVRIARANIARAGLSDLVRIEQGDFFSWNNLPSILGTVVMNPPYDERLGVADVAGFYERIGDRLKDCYAGWSAYILSGNLEAVKYIGLRSSQKTILFNGPIESRLLKFEMRARISQAPTENRPKPVENPEWEQRAEMFSNRLKKNLKRPGTSDLVYDWDIPELPFVVERKNGIVHFQQIPRNWKGTEAEHKRYIRRMVLAAATVLNVPFESVVFSIGAPRVKGGGQK